MKQVKSFSIVLQKPDWEVYSPGESVVGRVELRVIERFRLDFLRLVFYGESRVRWEEGTAKNRRVYKSSEKYFKLKMLLVDKNDRRRDGVVGQDADADFYMEAGDYSFPFHIVLPPNLPTSFEHTNAIVRYRIAATIDLPSVWKLGESTHKIFSVVNQLDLNDVIGAHSPTMLSQSMSLWCGMFNSREIKCELAIQKSGFVPGETIVLIASIHNATRRTLRKIALKLVQIISVQGERFRVHYKTFRQQVNRKSVSSGTSQVAPCSTADLDAIELEVPAVCPTSIGSTCAIIDVSYELVFQFSVSGPHTKKEFRLPVIIGTKPLQDSSIGRLGPPLQSPHAHRMDIMPFSFRESVFGPVHFGDEAIVMGADDDDDDAPPDYNQVCGPHAARDHGDETRSPKTLSFTPLYPFYGLPLTNTTIGNIT